MKSNILIATIVATILGTSTFFACTPQKAEPIVVKKKTAASQDPAKKPSTGTTKNPTTTPNKDPVSTPSTDTPIASVTLVAKSASNASGTVSFYKVTDGLRVVAKISGVAPGKHGFHIHEKGDCSAADATSAGGHFNPEASTHAGPHDAKRHAGDLGNILIAADGTGTLDVKIGSAADPLDSALFMGKAVILHAAEDDLTSQPVGNAGARIACGVIADPLAPAKDITLAVADLESKSGSMATGTVKFIKSGTGISILANLAGVSTGDHAIHIHEKGDCSAADGTSTGGHFNPGASTHSDPHSSARHAGDFGNITIDAAGKGELNIKVSDPAGFSDWSAIVGKAVIIHAAADDFTTQPTGNAGARIACGVIVDPESK